MKTDRLLLVAIVAVMAAVVGYLFFSDDAAPGENGGAAARSSAGDPLTTLGAFEEQKRLEKARAGCVEFELPSDFKGRSAEEIAAYFGHESMPYRISTANGNADGFKAGQKIYAPAEWVAERQRAQSPASGTSVTPLHGGEALPLVAEGGAVDPDREDQEEQRPPAPAPEKLANREEPKAAPRTNDPSETPQPWGFLMRKVPASGSGATAQPANATAQPAAVQPSNAKALEASATAKPTPGKSYRARQGDTLWKIAEIAYGKGSRYKEIARANEALVGSDGSLLRAGMVLRIP